MEIILIRHTSAAQNVDGRACGSNISSGKADAQESKV